MTHDTHTERHVRTSTETSTRAHAHIRAHMQDSIAILRAMLHSVPVHTQSGKHVCAYAWANDTWVTLALCDALREEWHSKQTVGTHTHTYLCATRTVFTQVLNVL
eukprot:13092736-Alexandrium_andersonii.AAC.1